MTAKRFPYVVIALVSALSINSAFALPIDWTGVFGVDTHLLNNVCRTKDDVPSKFNATTGVRDAEFGTQGITGDCGANFQTYIFKLNPQIIVNDGVTLKGEFSSGYLRGGFAGDNATNGENGTGGSYFFSSPAQRSGLNVNQMYMELYADTALIRIGRMARNYGMGIVFDGGNDPWDRFFTMYDGIDAEMKIGNFSVTPYYAKISTYDDNNAGGRPNGARPSGGWDVRETGITAKYDNKARDLVVSVLYGKRFSEAKNTLYNNGPAQTTPPASQTRLLGKTEVTVIEPYVSKRWNKFKIEAEGSLQSGDYGDVYESGEKSRLAANAYIANLKYDLNPKWDMGATLGQVDGDNGGSKKFEAAYLHPNFHIADLMFRYSYPSFNEGGKSIFDSSITNAQFWKIYGNYKTDKWTWKGAFVMANAMKAAKVGRSYHHEEHYAFTGTETQKKDYGYEFDFGFDYRWNPNVVISGYYGYWVVGDYFAYSNKPKELDVVNVHGGGLRATLEF
ncbi:MAG: hypothetical protein V4598_14680 [Bdellovibrionota bacterium]